ncbi:MAG: hypothetical protein MI861_25135 [Pirellulales bacterium]|nr:hypothetical protein [Pirellulales bacterium]
MDDRSQMLKLGRFLYTQNPFYLISCFLIIDGLLVATAGGDLHERSVWLALSLAGYTALMSAIVTAVVRWGKVWEDARSIFLVVIISHLALSVSFDLLCLDDWRVAARLLAGCFAFSIASTEFVLRACRVRFPGWYRWAYYCLLLVFFSVPVLGGYSVAENHLTLARWLGPLFSSLIAAALLMLVPAIRRGRGYVQNNGTPWKWPLFPISAFVVVVVGAAIRSHAIWMSFGSFAGRVVFEPFLLMPIVFSLFVLAAEMAIHAYRLRALRIVMLLAPLLLLLGLNHHGMTHLAIEGELSRYAGSAITLALAAIVGFYAYLWIRKVRWAGQASAFALVAVGLGAELPAVLQAYGLMPWMITLTAAAVYAVDCLRNRLSDAFWLAFAVMVAVALFQALHSAAGHVVAIITVVCWMQLSIMVLGALFKTPLADELRQLAAATLLIASPGVLIWHFRMLPEWQSLAASVALLLVTLAYLPIVKRMAWLKLGMLNAVCVIVVLIDLSGWKMDSISQSHWPIPSGLICLAIGLTITSFKSGVHRRFRRARACKPPWADYQRGF